VDIKVHKTTGVISDECHACLKCVAVCPEKNTLYISSATGSGILKPLLYAATICLLFMGGSIIGRLTGHWQTSISNYEYSFHVAHLDTPFYQHNRGQVPIYNKDAWMMMMERIKKAKGAWRKGQRLKN
jgi:ferredoxin